MSDIEITITRKENPTADNKPGVVYDHTGKRWGAWRPLWDQMFEGSTFIVQKYNTFVGRTGQTFYTITAAVAAGQTGYGNSQYYNGQRSPPPPRQVVPPPDDTQRQMHIFVCGAFNNWLRSADPEATQMAYIDQLHKIRSAWMAVFGPSPLPARQPVRQDPISSGPAHGGDLDDEIPF